MTSRPHDALFKAAFANRSRAAALLQACLPPPIAALVDWATLRLEPGSFIDEALAETHTDLLLSAEFGDAPGFIYVLFEHQSEPDPWMPLRMLEYIARIWRTVPTQSGPAPLSFVVPVVLSHGAGGWTAPRSLDAMLPSPPPAPELRELQPRLDLTVIDVSRWSNAEIRRRVDDTFARLVFWVLRDARSPRRLLTNLQHWANAFAEASAAPDGLRAVAVLVRYLWLVTEHLHFDTFRARLIELEPSTEPTLMTIAEQLRQEGAQRALTGMLIQLLETKFGTLADAARARIEVADLDALRRWVPRVLTAGTVDDLLAD